MPEHVHLLVAEPEEHLLSKAIQALKQPVSRHLGDGALFWHRRYYDFNVRTERKRIEKLRYIHRNPVLRGLVASPEAWPWTSFRQYVRGEKGTVTVILPWRSPASQTTPPASLKIRTSSNRRTQKATASAVAFRMCTETPPAEGKPAQQG